MALDQQYRKMLRDLMLGSDALSGQQTLPDGSIIGYDANTPDDMIAAVANPQPPMSEIQQQQTEQPRTPQRISDLLVSQRPQDFGDQQRFDEAYQFKQQMPEGQSYLRNNTTGAVQTLPSGQRQNAATAPSNAFNDLIRFGQVNSIDPATIGRLIKYQSSVQAGMPSAKDLYTASFKYNKPIGEMLDYYGAAAAGQSAQNAAQMQGEKDRLGLEKQRLELAQARGGVDPEVRKQQSLLRMYESMPDGPVKAAFGQKYGFIAKRTKEDIDTEGLQRAQQGVATVLTDLGTAYQSLQEKGAMVDPKKSWADNLGSRIAASWPGQMIGGAIGTEEQTIRDKISTMRPILINEIRKATQMGAKGMDSEKELQFYLQAATDPTKSIDANLDAIDRLNKAYGLGMDLGFGKQLEKSRGGDVEVVEKGVSKSGRKMIKRKGSSQWEYE